MARMRRPHYWIAFVLGGTKMQATVFDRAFKACGSRRKKTKEFRGPRAGLAGIAKTIEEAIQDADIPRRQVRGIGIGCPGVLDLDRGIVLHAPNLGWRNLPVARVLQKQFGC